MANKAKKKDKQGLLKAVLAGAVSRPVSVPVTGAVSRPVSRPVTGAVDNSSEAYWQDFEANKGKEFWALFEKSLGGSYIADMKLALRGSNPTSIRLNSSKLGTCPFPFRQSFSWSDHTYLLEERPSFTFDPIFHAGAYYVQDISSLFPIFLLKKHLARLDKSEKIRVLDLCAAPGGKTTALAGLLRAKYGDNFLLVANEVVPTRATVLQDNVAIWGDSNVFVTGSNPEAFEALEEFFDVILTDVPCSGEGMFMKEEQAVKQWSLEKVQSCAKLQQKILTSVVKALKTNGLLIYSTCTYNNIENDKNVGFLQDELGFKVLNEENLEKVPMQKLVMQKLVMQKVPMQKNVLGKSVEGKVEDTNAEEKGEKAVYIKTSLGYSLLPSLLPGHGQYCSILQKENDADKAEEKLAYKNKVREHELGNIYKVARNPVCENVYKKSRDNAAKKVKDLDFWEKAFEDKMLFDLRGENLIAYPQHLAFERTILEENLNLISSGILCAKEKGGKFVPYSDLALNLKYRRTSFPEYEITKDQAIQYLRKEVLRLNDAPQGYVLLTYQKLPLGFVNNIGTRCNNLHPVHRRIKSFR